MAITRKTKAALKKYGVVRCVRAFYMNERDGYGASSIGIEFSLTTRQADAAIDAGREYISRCTSPISTLENI